MFPYVLDDYKAKDNPEEYYINALPIIDASTVPFNEECEKIMLNGIWYRLVFFDGEELSIISERQRDYYLSDIGKLERYLKKKLKEPGFEEWVESVKGDVIYD